jgi:hypothetical protein
MAGDWIAIRCDLATEPEVIAIADATGLDEFSVVGRLHRLWSWANRHTTDGNARSVTFSWIDRYLQHNGFAQAMQAARWLEMTSEGVTIPHFDRFNSQSGKQRLLTAKRVSEHKRKGNAPGNAKVTLDALPKEQNRTEESSPSSPPPPAPQGGDSQSSPAWRGVEEDLRKAGVRLSREAADSARSNGCSSDDVVNLICYWRLHPGAWDAGALYQRVTNLAPGQDCSELWPEPAPRFVAEKHREQSSKSHVDAAAQRKAAELAKAADDKRHAENEAKFGPLVDEMQPVEIRELIRRLFPTNTEFMLKRYQGNGVTGVIRSTILDFLSETREAATTVLEPL